MNGDGGWADEISRPVFEEMVNARYILGWWLRHDGWN